MDLTHPTNYLAVQPAIRHADEEWHVAISLVWCPRADSYTIGVTLTEGSEPGDLRSEVVGPPVRAMDLATALRHAWQDVLVFEARTRNPFDDLT